MSATDRGWSHLKAHELARAAYSYVARYNAREREGILWERLRYPEQMIRAHTATLEAIVARHRTEVERLERLLGINDTKVEAA